MTDNPLIKKIKALITIRAIFVTLLLGLFFLLQVGQRSFPYPRVTSSLIIALYLLTIAYALLLRRVKKYTAFAYMQLFTDALAINMLIYLTGGIESWFSFIMPLTVISASTVLNKKAGYIIATFNSIVYGTIIDLQYYNLLRIGYDAALAEKDFLYNIFAHMSALYLVAFLSGYLSSRLEKTSEVLEQTDSSLRELTHFNQKLIENIPSGIFTTDTKGQVLLFNKAAENITGITKEVAMNQKIETILPFIRQIDNMERFEGIIHHRKEGSKTIGLTISSLRDFNEKKIGFIGIFQDLTQIKQMESEMKQREKWAAIGELSASIAHEIRNPLASLKGSIEILREKKVAEEYKERLTEIALKEMDRLNRIITDFLTYSRPKSAERKIFDVNAVLEETLELLKNTVSDRNDITIKKEFSGPINVNADQKKMQQVFWNLGKNAIEAMPSGGELSVGSEKRDDFVEVVFRDTGIGISKENIGKIFYPFFTTKDEGTGLGLAIAYRIIEEHQGKISVSSDNGGGTTFKVLMPGSHGKLK